MRYTPANAGGARGVRTQPKRTFIPPETVAAVSSEVVHEPEILAGLRTLRCLCRDLFQVRVLHDLRKDARAGDDEAHGLVGVIANRVCTRRPSWKVHRLTF